jgi:hypothetical protein
MGWLWVNTGQGGGTVTGQKADLIGHCAATVMPQAGPPMVQATGWCVWHAGPLWVHNWVGQAGVGQFADTIWQGGEVKPQPGSKAVQIPCCDGQFSPTTVQAKSVVGQLGAFAEHAGIVRHPIEG